MLAVIRGGGDLATGVTWRLTRAGVDVVVAELEDPLTVRRTVAMSSAVTEGAVDVEGMVGRLASDPTEATTIAAGGEVAVLVSPSLPPVDADVVVDARLAKRNLDTTIDDAPLVIGLGPGFTAGVDCDGVVETLRGPRLGRLLLTGSATANTATPGIIGDHGRARVLRAPVEGSVCWQVAIGDRVEGGQALGRVAKVELVAPFTGLVRGLIRPGRQVEAGLKIGDVDPRLDCSPHEISDKALAVGGGVLEAVTAWLNRSP
ncbi:MAG: EF2563 family selenium-dependent molybdenum hydroxylase system protein [Actinomycetia bacterium]|nr:EF2563 family selenium-dependent molybdenum hydroxylase system protein [Actinomycetes bacterium]